MATVPPSSPTAWRRWMALELRRLRRESGLSTQQVADQMPFSKGRLSFLENAERPARVDDLDELLPFYGVPEDRRRAYYQAARDARAKGWWERYDGHTLPDWFGLYVGLEQGAVKLSAYQTLIVHGLFQTPEYTAAVMRGDIMPVTEDEVRRRVEVRTERQTALHREVGALDSWLVLSEAALRNVVGDHETMAAQLRHLASLAEQPNITVQVVPFDHGDSLSMGPFTVLDFGWPNDHGLVYVEYRGGSIYPDSPREVDAHRLAFQHLCAQALPAKQSAALIRSAAREHADA